MDLIYSAHLLLLNLDPKSYFFDCFLVPVPSLGCGRGEQTIRTNEVAIRVVHPIVTALLGCPYGVVFEIMSG